jgi:hypothetical protein
MPCFICQSVLILAFIFSSQAVLANEIHNRSADITVVKVEEVFTINQPGGRALDLRSCHRLSNNFADCTQSFETLTQMPSKERIEIVLRFRSAFECTAIRVVTASRKSALAAADGIGFFSSGLAEGRFVPISKLKMIGQARFRNGELAVLHEFSGVSSCVQLYPRTSPETIYSFKPYMRFTSGQHTYFNWDQVERNYLLNPSVRGFDRSREVLR